MKKANTNQFDEFILFKKSIDRFLIVAKTDHRGIIKEVNDNFCRISKFSREELVGRNHNIVKSNYHSPEFFKNLWATISSGHPWQGIICNKAKDESLYWVQTFIFPNYDSDNNIIEYTSLRFDITHEVQLEQELKQERENLELTSQLAAVGEMSASIVHEINNPLTLIQGSLSLLKKNLDSSQKSFLLLEKMEKGVKRIKKIAKGLHHMAQKPRTSEFKEVNFKTIIDNLIDFSEDILRHKNIKLLIEMPQEDIYINCNETKISQVLLNLVNNAKDAICEEQSHDGQIKISILDKRESIHIEIVDNGPGIPDEIRPKIMQSFFTTKKVGKGTGLGLSLVHRYLNEHKGSIELLPNTEMTIFSIKLPKNLTYSLEQVS